MILNLTFQFLIQLFDFVVVIKFVLISIVFYILLQLFNCTCFIVFESKLILHCIEVGFDLVDFGHKRGELVSIDKVFVDVDHLIDEVFALAVMTIELRGQWLGLVAFCVLNLGKER